MSEAKNPYICEKCGQNLLKTGVACTDCMKLLCPVCDCAYSVDYYCYCTDCRQMVSNRFAVSLGEPMDGKTCDVPKAG